MWFMGLARYVTIIAKCLHQCSYVLILAGCGLAHSCWMCLPSLLTDEACLTLAGCGFVALWDRPGPSIAFLRSAGLLDQI